MKRKYRYALGNDFLHLIYKKYNFITIIDLPIGVLKTEKQQNSETDYQ